MASLLKNKAVEGGSSAAIDLHDMVFSWPKQQKPILHIPTLNVQSGEHVFLSGASGSGKSTLLSLIAGILKPSSGNIFVDGTKLNSLTSSKRDIFRGDHIGYIFQQFNLVPYLSVIENVLVPCRFSNMRHERAIEQAGEPLLAAQMLLERLDLAPDLWNKKADILSVGQQQRVAAARALIGKPALLIADEPTSALDADRRTFFLNLLLQECAEAGSTLLFVSHDKNFMNSFSKTVHLDELNIANDIEEMSRTQL